MRWLVITIVLLSVVCAMGEKPKQQDAQQINGAITADQPATMLTENKATADDQYLWIIQNYSQAQRDRYDKSVMKTLVATDYFIEKYPKDLRLPTVYFYVERLHSWVGAVDKQKVALKKYFEIAATTNPVYQLAVLDRADFLASAGKTLEAVREYEDVYATAPINSEAKDSALFRLIPSYEQNQQTEKLKVVYAFFIKNPDKLPNRDLQQVYAYKLGVIYYEEGNKKEAAKYFTIVKSGTSPALKLFKESISTKYKL